MKRSILFLFALLALAVVTNSAPAQTNTGNNATKSAGLSTGWITDTVYTALQENRYYRGIITTFDITDTAGTASVILTIQGYDATSGKYYTLLAGAAKTAPGTTTMVVYPGCIAASNTVANSPVPVNFRYFLNVPAGDSVKAKIGTDFIR